MKVFIKYCGGCNPRYDRVKEVDNFKSKYKDIEFTYDYDNDVEICLIICGCNSACADISFIDKNKKTYIIKSKYELENIKL
ncbi:hypothetical protein NE604_04840 [Anaerofustis stercorihominis]|uniref:Uncharacterized protein n=1 Tax=Anaerofustis stercorihominis DSM 17244 TaxID=445971 RepID=B1C6G8_9FIRM|nr:hypothetical protein [Anaerofustis stercorihominis]EDS73453.1 hypothetical protein ANASTE_00308 [Anaerofustis stercorihominis DSM 17244]MCQ4794972.1 hypothetical protein [Anaerofustis stercorihominis]